MAISVVHCSAYADIVKACFANYTSLSSIKTVSLRDLRTPLLRERCAALTARCVPADLRRGPGDGPREPAAHGGRGAGARSGQRRGRS